MLRAIFIILELNITKFEMFLANFRIAKRLT